MALGRCGKSKKRALFNSTSTQLRNRKMARPRHTEEQKAAAKERAKKQIELRRQTPESKEWHRAYDRKRYLKLGKPYVRLENVGRKFVSKPKTWADRYALRVTTSVLLSSFETVVNISNNVLKIPSGLPPPDAQMLIAFIKTNLYESLIKLEILANAELYNPTNKPKRKVKPKAKRKRPRKSADKTGKSFRGRPPAKKTARATGDEGVGGA